MANVTCLYSNKYLFYTVFVKVIIFYSCFEYSLIIFQFDTSAVIKIEFLFTNIYCNVCLFSIDCYIF